MVENFGGSLPISIFGRQNTGGLAMLHSKIARIKIVGGENFGRMVSNRQICQNFVLNGMLHHHNNVVLVVNVLLKSVD